MAAFFFKKRVDLEAPPISVAILIPAHNEESMIADTVRVLLALNYPRDRFTVFVLADNCEDDTSAVARDAGAEVFERRQLDKRSKGYALAWCLKEHKEVLSQFDAVSIIDADTTVDSEFLREISASLSCPGVDVVQGYYGVLNRDENWRTALTYVGFCLFNHVRACGRSRLGGSSGLKGNGMAFRSSMLLKYGWTAHTMVEDSQFSIDLLNNNHLVHYNPDAKVNAEMPARRREANPQRIRWELGRLQLLVRFVPTLLWRSLSQRKWPYLDAALDLLVLPLSMFALFQLIALAAAVFLRPMWIPLTVAGLAASAFHVIAGLWISHVPRRIWLYLLTLPLFILWKLTVYARFVLHPRRQAFHRTVRKSEITGDEDD